MAGDQLFFSFQAVLTRPVQYLPIKGCSTPWVKHVGRYRLRFGGNFSQWILHHQIIFKLSGGTSQRIQQIRTFSQRYIIDVRYLGSGARIGLDETLGINKGRCSNGGNLQAAEIVFYDKVAIACFCPCNLKRRDLIPENINHMSWSSKINKQCFILFILIFYINYSV